MKIIPLTLLLLFYPTISLSEDSVPLNNFVLSPLAIESIGQQIWQNEGQGKAENLIVWNDGEDFPSLGIGHFIWFPKGVEPPFQESFLALLLYLNKSPCFPSWLNQHNNAPWQTREQFYAEINSHRTLQLRKLLENTLAEQTQFIIDRFRKGVPEILSHINDKNERQQLEHKITQLLQSPAGTYSLIDYIHFKGEGTSTKERYKNQGWGLLQVLQQMKTNSREPVLAFSIAADTVLTRRVDNAPRDESRWLAGWRNRLKTYTNFEPSSQNLK